ncbi:MAG: reverse transcriptase domain-containing protein [Desulfobacteraceae bacterium]|nr:reverse transcriptase domain-containing protein [Desulfobacteraceae bacterium]
MVEFTTFELHGAFEAVKENHGGPGVDGQTIGDFESDLAGHLNRLQGELVCDSYLPLPLLKILVAKKNNEPRGLCIPAVRDRVAQRAALARVEPVLEKQFEECSFGYRKGRSIRQAVSRIKSFYDQGFRWVVEADIDAFFDNVDHSLLMNKVRGHFGDSELAGLLERWIKADVWDGTNLQPVKMGIPQGSAISPLLANLFLDELDEAMQAKGYRFIRYADDYVILCQTRAQAFESLAFSKQVLAKLRLRLDDEAVTTFTAGFCYLGVFFLNSMIMTPFQAKKPPRKVLYYPPPMNLDAYMLKLRKGW